MARAITQALAVQQQHSAGATSFTTGASYTPAANALMLAHVQLGGASNSAIAPTLTGNGLTWVLKESNRSPSGDAGTVGLVYHAQGASPSNGALTLTRDSTYTWDMVLLPSIR